MLLAFSVFTMDHASLQRKGGGGGIGGGDGLLSRLRTIYYCYFQYGDHVGGASSLSYVFLVARKTLHVFQFSYMM